jgi:methylmalonyl-CoA/ethylmalonyl-CoA epimerase
MIREKDHVIPGYAMAAAGFANRYGLSFHHLGLAVATPEPALVFLQGLGYRTGKVVFDPLQDVNVQMCEHPVMPVVEIIFPGKEAGRLNALLARSREGLVYHVAYRTADLAASLTAFEAERGLRAVCVSAPKPAVLFNGEPVSFYMIAGMGLIELIEGTGDYAARM